MCEKWSKPRGCAVAQYDGDTTEYTIDDVPRKEGEYKRMITAIIDEGVFKLLTNVHAFARIPLEGTSRVWAAG